VTNPAHKPRPLFAFPRRDLDGGPKRVRDVLPAHWLAKELGDATEEGMPALSASKDGDVDLELTPAGGDAYLLRGHVHATVETTCGRCLGPASVPIDAELTLLLVPSAPADQRPAKGKRAKESEGEFEFDPDEADVAHYEGETVVLDGLVREAIVLDLPISPLCSENCAGMRLDPAVAARLAEAKIDPRLAPLAKLKKS
jgi:uncharacterized protein